MSLKAFAVAFFAALTLAAQATASRPATASEKVAIDRAVIASVKGDFAKTAHFRVFALRVSTVSHRYARASVTPYSRTGQQLTDTAAVALHFSTGHWHVVSLGTDAVGCQVLPKTVEHDLFPAFAPECR